MQNLLLNYYENSNGFQSSIHTFIEMVLYLVRVLYTTLSSNWIRLDVGYADVKWSIEANAFSQRNNAAVAIKLPLIHFIFYFYLNLKIEPFLFVLTTLYRQVFCIYTWRYPTQQNNCFFLAYVLHAFQNFYLHSNQIIIEFKWTILIVESKYVHFVLVLFDCKWFSIAFQTNK